MIVVVEVYNGQPHASGLSSGYSALQVYPCFYPIPFSSNVSKISSFDNVLDH